MTIYIFVNFIISRLDCSTMPYLRIVLNFRENLISDERLLIPWSRKNYCNSRSTW